MKTSTNAEICLPRMMDVIRLEGGNNPGEQKERGESTPRTTRGKEQRERRGKRVKEQREDTHDRDRIGAGDTNMHERSIRKPKARKRIGTARRQRLRGIAKDGESPRKDFVASHVIGRRLRLAVDG